ncbi:MAG: cation:proton antiporter [Acidimicrobiales bacterium]
MDFAQFLTDILVVLIAAKAAAELSERIGIPAVVGEIVAGVIVGPSVLGLVGRGDDVLVTLGEIGVVLLLLEVGMEMDLAELGKVGKASFLVATVGVITPMLLGFVAMGLVTDDFNTKLFMGAALTATSVGITARVFGDLRALATTEARLVLGAAVADDVMGLVVLTVVVRLVTEGSVSVLSVVWIVVVAVAFLVIGGVVGLRVAGPLFAFVDRFSRSTGTLVAIAFAFALGFARLAEAAKLAPIVGAFVAGVALSKASAAPRISRELAPVGHLFIPVFFLGIGIDADISAFSSADVLRDAGILLVVAAVGKLVSPLGAIGTRGDKVLIGLGMLPRGEVGLIFATIGLQNGILGDDLYAALLLVVLATTLITPPLLKHRYGRLRAAALPTGPPPDTAPPDGGWLVVADGEIDLAADPPLVRGLAIGLSVGIIAGRHRPTQRLLDWLTTLPDDAVVWDDDGREALLDLVERGNARSWRLLIATGLLARALPEVEQALRDREADQVSLDASAAYRLSSIERVRTLDVDDPLALELGDLDDVDAVLIALLAIDATDGASSRADVAEATARRIGLDSTRVRRVRALAEDGDGLLWSAAHRPSGLTEVAVLPLATHLGEPDQARSLYVLTALRQADQERWELERLRELHELIQAVLVDIGLSGTDVRSLVAQRRRQAIAAAGADAGADVSARIDAAPRSFVLRVTPEHLAAGATLVTPPPRPGDARVAVLAALPRSGPAVEGAGAWSVLVGAHDRQGLLAIASGVLNEMRYDVRRAVVATWLDGAAVEEFEVRGPTPPPADEVEASVAAAFDRSLRSEPWPGADVRFDDSSSPWHTICEVEAPDQPGLLHDLATAFTAAGVTVVAASIAERDADAVDTFELVNRDGEKLSGRDQRAVREFITGGAVLARRRFRSGLTPR